MSILKIKNCLAVVVLLGATSGYAMELSNSLYEDHDGKRAGLRSGTIPAHSTSFRTLDSDSDSDSDCECKGAKKFRVALKEAAKSSLTITAKSSAEGLLKCYDKAKGLREKGEKDMLEAYELIALGMGKRDAALLAFAESADIKLEAHVTASGTVTAAAAIEVDSVAAADCLATSTVVAVDDSSTSKTLSRKRKRR